MRLLTTPKQKRTHLRWQLDNQLHPNSPPAILIFRDGHREQVREYAIVGGTLYASGDYWQSGHWTKDVHLSTLNLPATLQANHDAGIKFSCRPLRTKSSPGLSFALKQPLLPKTTTLGQLRKSFAYGIILVIQMLTKLL